MDNKLIGSLCGFKFSSYFYEKTDYDFISPVVNFAGNTAIVGVGAAALTGIAYMSSSHLSAGTLATIASAAVYVGGGMAIIAGLTAVAAIGLLAYSIHDFRPLR